MRIIRGKYRGRSIAVPSGFEARPTTDFAKEALFDILENSIDFADMRVLDLFAGTGSIGFEFLSRGCKHVDAVEINGKYARFIQKNGDEMFPKQLTVFSSNALSFVEKHNLSYHIIFADPPYDLPESKQLPDLIFSNSTLLEDCDVIIEHSEEIDFSQHPNYLKTRNYGKVHFSFFAPLKNNELDNK